MALNQLYAVSGKKINPDYTSIIESQTPYLLGLKQQQGQDKLAKEGLDLRRQEMLTNEQLAREQLDEQKKQAKWANVLGVAGLGVKGGLSAYEYSEPFKNVVDKFLGLGGKATEPMSTYDALSKAGDWGSKATEMGGGMTDYLQGLGDSWGGFSDLATQAAGTIPKFLGLGGDTASAASDAVESATPYADYVQDAMDWISDLF